MISGYKTVLVYAVLTTLWMLGFNWMLGNWISDPVVLGWVGPMKGVVLVAIPLLLGYVLLFKRQTRKKLPADAFPSPPISRMIGLFIGLILIVPVLGYGIYRLYSGQVRLDAFADLDAIAALKGEQIESWLSQRQQNATLLSNDSDLARDAAQLLQNRGDAPARARIQARLEALRQVYAYDAILLDGYGRVILPGRQHAPIPEEIPQKILPLALQSGRVQRSELYRDASGGVHLDYIVPLQNQNVPQKAAAVLLHTPIELFLFPLIQRWPTPSRSAETMLVRQEGDKVLFLNELRHQHHTALTLRIPLSTGNSPSVLAVRAGQARHMEAQDQRGVAVLAASRPVAGTRWYVVAKMDRSEVLAPIRRLISWVSLVALGAVAALSAVLLMLWHQQRRTHQMALVAQAAEHDRLLRLFFDLPLVGMSITSPVSQRWIHVNGCLCNMLGYTREEMTALTWTALTHPDDLAVDTVELDRVLKGEINGYQIDKRFVHKSGEIVEVTFNVQAVRLKDGSVEWFVATVQDITAANKAKAAQKNLSGRITAMLESMADGFVAIDKDWRYLYVNHHATGIFGRDASGLIGKPIWEEFPEGEGEPFFQACQRVMAQQTPEHIENFYPRWKRWFENRIYPTPEGISIYFQDITERKRMEASLHESEARYRAIIDTEPECIKMIGQDGRLKFMNRAGLEMIEADNLEQVQGHSMLAIVTPDYREAFRRLTKRVLQGERGILEFEIVGLKGTRRFLETHAVALRTLQEEPYSLLSITRDITERKGMEYRLREQLSELLRWQEAMLGREERVQELKQEVNELLARQGQSVRYPSQVAA